jgi:hypothetical protein
MRPTTLLPSRRPPFPVGILPSPDYDSTEGGERTSQFAAFFADLHKTFIMSGRELYDSVSDWEKAKNQTVNRSRYPNDLEFKAYYRSFWGLHPRHSLDPFVGHDNGPTLASVTLIEFGGKRASQPLVPNIKMAIDILELGEMNLAQGSLKVTLKVRAVWKPALAEIRDIRNKVRPPVVCDLQIASLNVTSACNIYSTSRRQSQV